MITNSSNVQIKNLIKLQEKARTRREQNAFVVEGKKMFEEAKGLGVVKRAYATPTYIDGLNVSEQEYFQGVDYEIIDEKVMKDASDTMTPQGILAIVEKPSYTLEEMVSGETASLLLLEDLRDPGNLGTIIRTAEGAGIDGVIMSKETVDLFNPKVVRSTMGSIFRVPFLYTDDFYEVVSQLKEKSVSVVATDLQGKNSYDGEVYEKKTAIVIGNEANGISEKMRESADVLVRIPMEGKLESLNASVAAGIMMYELYRQRRNG
ncbi:MAG: 23S rRNA (guanosine(2251)-2'-O)-methyltransferase RlmB [Lachnospiraceae bacterium]|nr:23S rRNA (guanosine(2251)-2'-O)-methyltransferase RlmB [Lachnospiraceae bacterium]